MNRCMSAKMSDRVHVWYLTECIKLSMTQKALSFINQVYCQCKGLFYGLPLLEWAFLQGHGISWIIALSHLCSHWWGSSNIPFLRLQKQHDLQLVFESQCLFFGIGPLLTWYILISGSWLFLFRNHICFVFIAVEAIHWLPLQTDLFLVVLMIGWIFHVRSIDCAFCCLCLLHLPLRTQISSPGSYLSLQLPLNSAVSFCSTKDHYFHLPHYCSPRRCFLVFVSFLGQLCARLTLFREPRVSQ